MQLSIPLPRPRSGPYTPVPQITGGTFTNNVASAGGGGAVSFDGQSAELVILNSNFTGNSAPTNCGGGVYIITGAHLQLYGNNFIGNEAASGGGVRETAQCVSDRTHLYERAVVSRGTTRS